MDDDGVLTPVNRVTLAADICRKLVAHLMAGHWKEGQRIPPERVLCGRLGVGRASLREGLKALEIMGLIESRAGEGTFVCNRSQFFGRPLLWAITGSNEKDVRRLTEARRCLEIELAGFAAERADAKDLDVIKRRLDSMFAAVGRPTAFLESDLNFHLAIAAAADNRILLDALQVIRNLMRQWIGSRLRIAGVEALALEHHKTILEAIIDKDRDRARIAMATHLDTIGMEPAEEVMTAPSDTEEAGELRAKKSAVPS
jgi:GntR family transcriptional repressor for pyruvate dehydrogenase complex